MSKQAKKTKVPKESRPSWDEYFLDIAGVVSKRGTCDRARVGAVLVRDRFILATGYNGAAKGMPHCSEAGHEIVEGHCVRTVHAEANAIVQAARLGKSIENSTLYLTISPCYDCFKMIVNAGIKKVVYKSFYQSRYDASDKVLKLAKKAGVQIVKST